MQAGAELNGTGQSKPPGVLVNVKSVNQNSKCFGPTQSMRAMSTDAEISKLTDGSGEITTRAVATSAPSLFGHLTHNTTAFKVDSVHLHKTGARA